ncbi:MAG: glycosyl hydrolase [Clostridiales bacterium]
MKLSKKNFLFVIIIILSVFIVLTALLCASTEEKSLVFDFENDLQDWVNDTGHLEKLAIEHSENFGGSLKINTNITDDNSNWQEIRVYKDNLELDNYNAVSYDLYIDLTDFDMDVYGECTINPFIILDPEWVKYGSGMNKSKFNELEKVYIEGREYAKISIKYVVIGTEKTKLFIDLVTTNIKFTGDMYLDNINIFKMGTGTAPSPDPLSRTDKEVIKIKNKDIDRKINVVDKEITRETKSLFSYLKEVGNNNLLFGQQHATTEGLTIDGSKDGTKSDVYNCVGDFPALYGWDTLSIEGKESPGDINLTPEENALRLADVVKKAYERNGVITLSSHMPNFVTGKDFYDTSGSVISHILPGGSKHKEYNEFLDDIAYFGNNAKDSTGNLIPIIFRPFHENTGSWFWWGDSFCTEGQYKSIFRYTVEYLRDKKKVHNFVYAYSPSSDFNSEEEYLIRYPGDDYVDVMGFDQYDNSDNEEDSKKWLKGLILRCGIVTEMAEKRGKIAALTETGMSRGILNAKDRNLNWFQTMGNELKDATKSGKSKIAYMQVWANFDFEQFWTPYRNHTLFGNHDLMQDFVDFYNDDYIVFNKSLKGQYSYKEIQTEKEKPTIYIVNPTSGDKIKGETKIRVKINPYCRKIKKASISIVGEDEVFNLIKDNDGFYSYTYIPTLAQNGSKIEFKVSVKLSGGILLEDSETVKLFDSIPINTLDFKENISDASYEGSYSPEDAEVDVSSVTHDENIGNGSIKVESIFNDDSDDSNWTYQEMKIKIPDINSKTNLEKANQVKFDILLPKEVPDSLFKPYVILYKTSEPGYQKYAEGVTKANLKDFKMEDGMFKYTITADLTDQMDATDIVLAFVANDWNYEGPIYFDNVSFSNVAVVPTLPPNIVDNFEIYDGDDTELNNAYSKQGDTVAISLLENENYSLKYDYTISSVGYCGITKIMNNVDWNKYNALSLNLTPDGLGQKMVIQIKAEEYYFEAYPSLDGQSNETVVLEFSDFIPAPWQEDQSVILTDNLDNISQVSIYVNGVDSFTGTGTLIIDDIMAVTSK